MLLAAACVDGSSPTAPAEGAAHLLLVPLLPPTAGAASEVAPLTHAVITVRSTATGDSLAATRTSLDPAVDVWTVRLSVPVPVHQIVNVSVLVELRSRVAEVEITEWSGQVAPVSLRAGVDPQELRQVTLHRGPAANLSVEDVRINPVAAVVEGGTVQLAVELPGGGPGARAYFTSLDPEVARVDALGVVTTRRAGTARIEVRAGPRADTVSFRVDRFPVPPPEKVATAQPGMDDSTERLVPTLQDQASAAALAAHLGDLSGALALGEGLRATEIIAEARAVLAAYGAGSDARITDGPELSLIELVLDYTELLLKGELPTTPSSGGGA